MAHNFGNTSFETAGTNAMEPDDWTASITATAEEIAEYSSNVLSPVGTPWENMENGWRKPLRSDEGDFTLVNNDTLLLTVDGGSVQTVTFVTADFADINNATASEVAARIAADTTGVDVIVIAEQVHLNSATIGASASIQVTGGTAQPKLGFSTVFFLQSGNSFYKELFTGAPTDLEAAAYNDPGSNASNFESLEAEWANLSAALVTHKAEPFSITASNTLQVRVDAGATQTVTFAGTENTAALVAGAINTQTTGITATALSTGQVEVRSDTEGYMSSIQIVGGTATDTEANEGGEVGLSPRTYTIFGSQSYVTAFSGGTVGQFNSTDDSFDSFELEWPDNEDYDWFFTTPQFVISSVVAGDTIKLTVNGVEFEVDVVSGDTATSIGSDFETLINASSVTVTASSTLGVITLTKATDQERLQYFSTVTGTSVVLDITTNTSGALSFGSFDSSTPEDVEDFQEEWLDNEDDISLFAFDTVEMDNAINGETYTLTVNGEDFSETATGASTPTTIAAAIALAIGGSSQPIGAFNTAGVVTVGYSGSGNGAYKLDIETTTTGAASMTHSIGADIGGLLSAASFSEAGFPVTRESFEATLDGDTGITFVSAQTGIYKLNLNGQLFFVNNNSGTLSTTDIRDSFVSKVATGSITVNAVNGALSNSLLLRSKAEPPEEFGVSMNAPGDADQTLVGEVDISQYWSWSARMHTI